MYILDEFLTFIQRKSSATYTSQLANDWLLKKKGIASIISINENQILEATKLFQKQHQQRKPLSFTDCTNVIICKDNSISIIAISLIRNLLNICNAFHYTELIKINILKRFHLN